MTPQRIQLRRVKGWRMPPNTRKVDRSTMWGNPFDTGPRESQVELFRQYMAEPIQADLRIEARRDLRGKNLACWCPLPEPGEPDICHASVLMEIANA